MESHAKNPRRVERPVGAYVQESKLMKNIIMFLLLLLTACQSATSVPTILAQTDSEFTLAIGQSASIENAGLTVQLGNILSDNRCPSDVECVESGAVTLTISVQKDSASPSEFTLETFTDNNGLAPIRHFEGMIESVEYEGYLIQVKSILPYPAQSFGEIKDTDYRASFLVTEK